MSEDQTDQDAAPVPDGRVGRLLRLGSMTSGLMGDMAISGLRQIAKGQRPSLQNMLMTPMTATRVTRDLRTMRGAAMKMGQMLSMDPGFVLPPEMTVIMAALRDEARHMPPQQLRDVLNAEWGPDWRHRFTRFDVRPFAAASIGQVHRARTTDGRDLAIKVQYPAVRDSIDSDIDNIAALLRLSGMVPRGMDIDPMLAEARQQLHQEADYKAEADNLAAFNAFLAESDDFLLPACHPDLSTPRVLAMTYIDSQPIEALESASQSLRDQVAARMIDLVLRELFTFRTMQTDPNLANYRFDPVTGRIVLLDFGAVTRLAPALTAQFQNLLDATLSTDRHATRAAMHAIGYFGSATAAHHSDLIFEMFETAMIPIRQENPFDFGTSDIVTRLRDMGIALGRDRDLAHVPPAETLFLHRKIAGIYLMAARLKARVAIRPIVAPYSRIGTAAF
ncbi:AarF/ABC1/UbiB kinase family protein [Seohaeicola saemankumensis]|uniref:ABC1 kinase family protein n=1 Tax=Seohaeicola saemankumensis TaxID=481181 RepID=UPI001E60E197|nr:AarF/ABC1/UbiB kinase family protein [Seohaeicola saemankumensis]MCD1627804.1 AarF/ABC1/UbiB kinase family protein [Seohaeicola saemankumensis]